MGNEAESAGPVQSYRDLRVWQLAMDLAAWCYKLTQRFPKDEVFGLTSQIRRSSCSIAANIAEGYGRENRREYIQFLRIAQGSLKELETHLLIAVRAGVTSSETTDALLVDCEIEGKQLHALIRSLQAIQSSKHSPARS